MPRRLLIGAWLVVVLLPTSLLAQALSPQQQAKLPPGLRANETSVVFLGDALIGRAPLQSAGQTAEATFPVILRTTSPEAVRASGVHLNAVWGAIATAHVTRAEAHRLASLESVSRIEWPVLDQPTLDLSVPSTGAHLLHSGFVNDTPFRGEGALIMIIDTGIDFRHLDFIDPTTGASRIFRIWDQTRIGVAPIGFSYGVEYTREKLNDALAGLANPATKDTQGHGTHVAGIAAGNGAADGRLTGMAPGADLVIVKTNFGSDNFIDALAYADRLATETNRPIVANYSAGGHAGAHDGSAPHELAIDAFMANPGRIVVTSAGNDGNDRLHSGGNVAVGADATVRFSIPSYTPSSGTQNDYVLMNFYYESEDSLVATVASPSGFSTSAALGEVANATVEADGQVYLANERTTGSLKQITVQVFDATAALPPKNGTWTLSFANASGDIRYDGWMYAETVGATFGFSSSDTEQTISMPGTSRSALTVGAHVTKNAWWAEDGNAYAYSSTTRLDALANFSSLGPTRDGRIKPDLTAPGMGIFSATSDDYTPSTSGTHASGRHYITQGTSMSSPHVAGAVALLLGANPNLTANQVRDALAASAKPGGNPSPNASWGYGKLDVFKAFAHALAPGTAAERRWFDYYSNRPTATHAVSVQAPVAVRFTPSFAGALTGLRLSVDGFTGTGPIEVSVHAVEAGQPGSQIGNAVLFPSEHLDASTFINLATAGMVVEADTDFFVVLRVPQGTVTLDGDGDASVGRSMASSGSTWTPLGSEVFVALETSQMGANSIPIEAYRDPAPEGYLLSAAFPNPSVGTTHITLALNRTQHVRAEIIDVLGRHVALVYEGALVAGRPHVLSFAAAGLSPGLYFFQVKGDSFQKTRKVTLLR